MKKILKIINLIIIFNIIFSALVFTGGESFAFAASSTNPQVQIPQPPVAQTPANAANVNYPKTIPQKNAYELAHAGQSGFKYQVYKFFTAMFAVLVSALAIFFGLKIYKKVLLKKNLNLDNIDYDKTLETPKDFKEAINLFLDKTDKE